MMEEKEEDKNDWARKGIIIPTYLWIQVPPTDNDQVFHAASDEKVPVP